ncbi:MAG: peptidoglycan-binding protein [Actinobacteria bacterium]|nr:peptidoglycan-binding protein [Actinomycetota bacterium]
MTQLGSPATESGPSPDGQQPARGSRLARRRRVLLGVGIGAALLGVGGVAGASFVKSPQQLAADTAPPAPTVTTAKVVSQVLTSAVQMRGVVYPATQYDVYPSAPSAGSAAGSPAAGSGGSSLPVYISKLDVAAGATIRNGRQLAAIDGEPLFALSGNVPAWRDLAPGETGPDVRELQRALAALGYYGNGDRAGYFGPATEYAVSLYYEHLGYTPPSTGGVPAADVVFLPSLPATVVAVNGAAGQQPGQPFLELAARGSLSLTGELPPAYASQLKAGLKVKIFDELTGIRATGKVSELGTPTTTVPTGTVVDIGSAASSAGSAGSAAGGSASSSSPGSSSGSSNSGSSGSSGEEAFVPVNIRPSKPLAARLNGENVLVTVETGQTAGPVLTVPVAAIVTTASGRSYVTVVGAHGKKTEVAVTPGISGNGYVQVTPAAHGALAAGDRVVVSG